VAARSSDNLVRSVSSSDRPPWVATKDLARKLQHVDPPEQTAELDSTARAAGLIARNSLAVRASMRAAPARSTDALETGKQMSIMNASTATPPMLMMPSFAVSRQASRSPSPPLDVVTQLRSEDGIQEEFLPDHAFHSRHHEKTARSISNERSRATENAGRSSANPADTSEPDIDAVMRGCCRTSPEESACVPQAKFRLPIQACPRSDVRNPVVQAYHDRNSAKGPASSPPRNKQRREQEQNRAKAAAPCSSRSGIFAGTEGCHGDGWLDDIGPTPARAQAAVERIGGVTRSPSRPPATSFR